jgi:predicted transcriptional regulator
MVATNNEYSILLALWNAGHPLSAREIVDAIEDRSFKERTIHSILNAMLKKGLIHVDGQKLSSRIYSRCFSPSMRFEEYHAALIKQSELYRRDRDAVLSGVLDALVEEDVGSDTLTRLEEHLEERKLALRHPALG